MKYKTIFLSLISLPMINGMENDNCCIPSIKFAIQESNIEALRSALARGPLNIHNYQKYAEEITDKRKEEALKKSGSIRTFTYGLCQTALGVSGLFHQFYYFQNDNSFAYTFSNATQMFVDFVLIAKGLRHIFGNKDGLNKRYYNAVIIEKLLADFESANSEHSHNCC